MGLIDLGLIDGNYFNAANVDSLEAAINQCAPAGTVAMTIATVAPTGWLLLAGQVVANAQTLYPDLWAVAPVGWRSGASLTLPNMANRIPMGQGTTALDTVGGSSTASIAQANLPAVSVGVTGSTGTESVPHTHGQTFMQHPTVLVNGGGATAQVVVVRATGAQDQTGAESVPHTHPAGTLATAALGSGTALPLPAPPHFALNFIVKAH